MADADALRETGAPALPASAGSGSAPPPVAAPRNDSVMSLVDHLGELRTRLFRSILAVAVGSIVGFYFAVPIRNFLIAPLPGGTVQVLGIGDAFAIQLRISLIVGIILAMPVLLYQLWAFIAPGLTPAEQKAVRPWIPMALVFFALGVGIAYLVLPYAVRFLLSFTDEVFRAQPAAGPYFDFVTTMFLAFGLVMEFPILLVGLSRVGILSSQRLTASRRFVILGIAIFAAVATPGGDLVSPFVLGGTMYLLFELTVLFIRRSGR
ncbi:MAG: twin-arginine translocase subunit TatC [Candidatus Limnocylindrales bacterium]|nr:twin-arginine translocase subunit TatC [Candidatus Limnocylindrales bacterium]